MRANVAERDPRRLLHHVTELPGEDEVLGPVALHPRGLDEQDVAAGSGHGEAGRDARYGRPLRCLEEELLPAEVLAHVACIHGEWRGDLGGRARRRGLTKDLAQLALEVPDARLARVVADDRPEGLVGHDDPVGRETVLLDLTRK